ncbi:hypothetical protein THRCLA_20436 [Thraustotheca clavata]|uniref:Sfi1 spindle body domain-containing protein n=1 Tax=Thraustotheca clavata TaxID=74557 RepID=A0A1W0A7E9_9STRA|nr:hypothetical protein THRCLA_20436 [Thraustotheca clavata]
MKIKNQLLQSSKQKLNLIVLRWREWCESRLRTKCAMTYSKVKETTKYIRYWHLVANYQRNYRCAYTAVVSAINQTNADLLGKMKYQKRSLANILAIWRKFLSVKRTVRCWRFERIEANLNNIFQAWKAYHVQFLHRKQKSIHLMQNYWILLRQRVFLSWLQYVNHRRRLCSLTLSTEYKQRFYWKQWRCQYQARKSYRMRKIQKSWNCWKLYLGHRRQMNITYAFANACAIHQCLQFWYCSTKTAILHRNSYQIAIKIFRKQQLTKLFWHLKQFIAQCHDCEELALNFKENYQQRQIRLMWHAWHNYCSTRKAQNCKVSNAINSLLVLKQSQALKRWLKRVKDNLKCRDISDTAVSKLNSRLLTKWFQQWYCYANKMLMIKHHCILMGQLITSNVMQSVLASWVEYTQLKKLNKAKMELATMHQSKYVLAILFPTWILHTEKRRKLRKAMIYFSHKVYRAIYDHWIRFCIECKAERFSHSIVHKLFIKCFYCWLRHHLKQRLKLKHCYINIRQKFIRNQTRAIFTAWKTRSISKSKAYYACLAHLKSRLRCVLLGWKKYTKLQHLQYRLQESSAIVFGTLQLNETKGWTAWRQLYLAIKFSREKTLREYWFIWNNISSRKKFYRFCYQRIQENIAQKLLAHVFYEWKHHAHDASQLRRKLVAKRQREHSLVRFQRLRRRQLLQRILQCWFKITKETMEILLQNHRLRVARILESTWQYWKNYRIIQSLIKLKVESMVRWRSRIYVARWYDYICHQNTNKEMNKIAQQCQRKQLLLSFWNNWTRFTLHHKKVRIWSQNREKQRWTKLLRRWQYNIHIFRLDIKSQLYARLRLVARLFHVWQLNVKWLQQKHNFIWHVQRSSWLKSYVRHWNQYARLARSEANYLSYMNLFKCRKALEILKSAKAQRENYNKAIKCHLKFLWRRWQTRVLECRAQWWYDFGLMRCKFQHWTKFCALEQTLRFHTQSRHKRQKRLIWRVWRLYVWSKQANAQASAFARFQRLHTALRGWCLGMNIVVNEYMELEERAQKFNRLMTKRRSWNAFCTSTKEQRKRQLKMVQSWQSYRKELLMSDIWRRWFKYCHQKVIMVNYLKVKNRGILSTSWAKWQIYREINYDYRKKLKQASMLYAETLLRKLLLYWHVYTKASNSTCKKREGQ